MQRSIGVGRVDRRQVRVMTALLHHRFRRSNRERRIRSDGRGYLEGCLAEQRVGDNPVHQRLGNINGILGPAGTGGPTRGHAIARMNALSRQKAGDREGHVAAWGGPDAVGRGATSGGAGAPRRSAAKRWGRVAPTILACDPPHRAVPRGSFAIWFAILDLRRRSRPDDWGS